MVCRAESSRFWLPENPTYFERLFLLERKKLLSRKDKESILIGHTITVTVLEIRGKQATIGIEAPRKIPVHRKEVYKTITRSDVAGNAVETVRQQSFTAK